MCYLLLRKGFQQLDFQDTDDKKERSFYFVLFLSIAKAMAYHQQWQNCHCCISSVGQDCISSRFSVYQTIFRNDDMQCSVLIYFRFYAIIKKGDDMKKALIVISIALSAILSVAYITVFSLNVTELVQKHMELEVSYPLYAFLLSFLVAVIMLGVYLIKRYDYKLFLIPAMFFISSIITFIIAFSTPCPYCI